MGLARIDSSNWLTIGAAPTQYRAPSSGRYFEVVPARYWAGSPKRWRCTSQHTVFLFEKLGEHFVPSMRHSRILSSLVLFALFGLQPIVAQETDPGCVDIDTPIGYAEAFSSLSEIVNEFSLLADPGGGSTEELKYKKDDKFSIMLHGQVQGFHTAQFTELRKLDPSTVQVVDSPPILKAVCNVEHGKCVKHIQGAISKHWSENFLVFFTRDDEANKAKDALRHLICLAGGKTYRKRNSAQ